ncbi:helix-turn-helix transcriptional regulator [Prevotella aurantiaca JCM 15754]|jgi:hypothetical protein|uniref:Helix-turn-helix transcriptional regulator n=1 Tax=Prevotella aurantiaca TaxID=596085 RepID=A0A930HL59_9BACT|nr:helix-turn-helix transcriptional regulator [Prevotella aurantiaca]MBF1383822.1 helix-turn-helix transcriptional regulator [Prevotella aurantiaca]MBF1386142.1 helix-turn-helix transcriptional regulator [Prevotella aurantiaca]
MKDRIKRLMESQHMTQQTFADFIGISSASLSSIFNGRTKPTLNTVEAIKGKFPTLSLDWIMYGVEPMFKEKVSELQNPDVSNVLPPNLNLFDEVPSAPLTFTVDERRIDENSALTPKDIVKTEVKYIDKPQRNITEIRIFFDDQTWETFVPKK